jgi:hypothetical protein
MLPSFLLGGTGGLQWLSHCLVDCAGVFPRGTRYAPSYDRGGRHMDERTGRPPEAADSLTPLSDWARPIDPDAADRQRYAMAEAVDSPRLRRVGGPVGAHNDTESTARPVGRVRTRRLVGPPQATRHFGSLAWAPRGSAAGVRRPSRPAA